MSIQENSHTDFSDQVNKDQKRYSRYVCDSRAIPHAIDGLKPVQRRILWTMWNSSAKETFTKTVKVAGMTMAYHPHGNTSIEDAISQMVQNFTFANNYPLISGEGTFGDILDPKAIASPRYTEVKVSNFAKEVGLFESIPDIDYISNYDETSKEPIFFIPKIPLVFLNPILGIATGFRCNMPGHQVSAVIESMVQFLKNPELELELTPWYRGLKKGNLKYFKNETQQRLFTTQFEFLIKKEKAFLVGSPQNWNREKTIIYLESIIKENENIKDYLDNSKDSFCIEIIFKRGVKVTPLKLVNIFNKTNQEVIEQNVITYTGNLKNCSDLKIIKDFCFYRKKHLILRFKRLAKVEKERVDKLKELIRFIKENWHKKTTKIKNKSIFEKLLENANFYYYKWLVEIPLYRLTKEEVTKSKKVIKDSKKQYSFYQELIKNDSKLVDFMIEEIEKLKKWDIRNEKS